MKSASLAGDADPDEAIAALDRVVRVLLPAYLESLGYASAGARLRALPEMAILLRTDAGALRELRREISWAMQDAYLAEHARMIASLPDDELEALHARRAVEALGRRMQAATSACSLVLDIAGDWTRGALRIAPSPGPTPRECAAIALREIMRLERDLAPEHRPRPLV